MTYPTSRSNSLAQFAMAPSGTVIGSELSAIPQGGPWEGRDPRDPRDPAEMEIRFSEEDELAQSVAEMEAHLESPWFAIFFWSFFLGEMVWKWYEMENRAPKSQGLYFWYKLQVDGLGPFLTKV